MADQVRAAADPPSASDEAIVSWSPRSAPQAAYITCPVFEIFYGGSRGSLKTEGTLGDWLSHSDMHGEDAVGLMVRRTREQLKETFERAKRLYVPLGFHPAGHVITSPQGARLRFAYLERDAHAENYQGDNNTRVYVEEIGNFANPAPVMKLMATLRSTKGVPVGFRATGNPGGPGHGWVKKRYISPAPLGWKVLEEPFVNPWTGETVMKQRIFIPGKITDHNLLGPEYIANLQMSGSPEMVRAWLEGDWDVVAGAYFPEFSRGRHVLDPLDFPADWRRFTASDWGSARPFWTGWFVIVQREMKARTATGRPVTLLPGALVCYREWYGEDAKRPGQNLGLKWPVEEWAAGVLKRSHGEGISYDVVATSMFSEDGGPSLAERGGKVSLKGKKLRLRPADRQRLPGWNQVRYRLRGDLPDEQAPPMLFFTTACEDAIRTLAALQHDDVESKFEDADCWVAGTMIATPTGERPIETIGAGDWVNTPIGPRVVLKSYISGPSETVRVDLSDGRVLCGTARHKIHVEGVGLVRLDELKCHLIPTQRIIWQKLLFIVASSIEGTRGAVTTILAAVGSLCIGRSGLICAGQSLTGTTFTTETRITTTTTSAICSVSSVACINGTTSKNAWRESLGSNSRNSGRRQPGSGCSGTTPRKCLSERPTAHLRAAIVAGLSLRDTLAKFGALLAWPFTRRAGTSSKPAKYAVLNSGRRLTAPKRSEPARIVAVGRCEEKTPVYNLTVDGAHLFYANGILSSNTDGEDHPCDGVRYGCMSRPRKLPEPEQRFAHLPKKGTGEWQMTEAWKGRQIPGLSRRPLD